MNNDVVMLVADSSSEAVTAGTLISGSVKSGTFDGLTGEIVGVLPIVLPVLVTMIALRKGLSFLLGTLRGA